MISNKLLISDYPLNNKYDINELLFNKIEYIKNSEEFNDILNNNKSDTLILRRINTNKKEDKTVNYNYILNNCKPDIPLIKKPIEEDYHNVIIDIPNDGDGDDDDIDKMIQGITSEIFYMNNQLNNMALSNFIMKSENLIFDKDDKSIFKKLSKIINDFNKLNEQPSILKMGKKIKSSYLMFDGKKI